MNEFEDNIEENEDLNNYEIENNEIIEVDYPEYDFKICYNVDEKLWYVELNDIEDYYTDDNESNADEYFIIIEGIVENEVYNMNEDLELFNNFILTVNDFNHLKENILELI